MLRRIGPWIHRLWPYGVSAAGGTGLALFSTIWQDAHLHVTELGMIGLLVLCVAASLFSGPYVGWRASRAGQSIEVELLSAIRSTLTPVARDAIEAKKPLVGRARGDFATSLALHCRALTASIPGASDANVYSLTQNGLLRQNRASLDARKKFVNGGGKSASDIEESATVRRITASEVTICSDVNSKREQRRLKLEPKKRAYRSFVTVPILNEARKPIGMLSLNSARKGALTHVHVGQLQAVAQLYAAAVAARP